MDDPTDVDLQGRFLVSISHTACGLLRLIHLTAFALVKHQMDTLANKSTMYNVQLSADTFRNVQPENYVGRDNSAPYLLRPCNLPGCAVANLVRGP